MKKDSKISKLQSFFGVTKTEVQAISIIILGLLLGGAYKIFFSNSNNSLESLFDEILRLNDSLALAQQTTYIGSDAEGNYIPELKEQDTLVKKINEFPVSIKKELPSNKINLNTASKVELMKLPGIGEKTALKIIEYRNQNRFRNIEDIKNIKGIGEKKFEKMKQYLDVK